MIRTIVLAACMVVAATAVGHAQTADDACQIAALIDTSAALGLPPRVERAFLLTLRTADAAHGQGEIHRALTLLRTFVFEVRGVRRAKRLPSDAADMLLARAEDAIRELARSYELPATAS